MQTKIIVGLGNPGKKYEKTRHNVGFMVMGALIEMLNSVEILNYKFIFQKKFNAQICRTEKDFLLVRPQTFMNESGQAVLGIAHEVWGLEALERNINDLWVVHDDMDLDFGRIKIHTGGSSGHHGIDSIIKAVGSSDFIKFRIGIGRMVAENSHQYGNQEFLLSPFTKEEETTIKGVVKKTAEAILLGLDEGIAKAMNKFNK